MSRFIRTALVVGASALATWALLRVRIRVERIPTTTSLLEDGVVGVMSVDLPDSTTVPREELLARIQERVGEFTVLPPSDKVRFQIGESGGDLEGHDDMVTVEMYFTENDPFAIGVRVIADEDTEGFFLTSRDDLLGALAGEETTPGFVVAQRDDDDEDVFHFFVQTPGGYRRLTVPSSTVETFLAATNALVPLGEEPVDWESAAKHFGLDPSQLQEEDDA